MDIPKWTEIVVECESEYIDPVSQLLQKFAIDGIVIEAVSYTHLTLPTKA